MCKLKAAGYACCVFDASTIEFGLPQDRPRLWFVCVLASAVPLSTASELETMMNDAWDSMKRGHQLMELERFLLEEDHPYMKAFREECKAIPSVHERGAFNVLGVWVSQWDSEVGA